MNENTINETERENVKYRNVQLERKVVFYVEVWVEGIVCDFMSASFMLKW